MKTFRVTLELEFDLPDEFELSSRSHSAIKHNKRLFFPEIKWTDARGIEPDNKPVELRLPVRQVTEITMLDNPTKII
jgi:hypothetical protein